MALTSLSFVVFLAAVSIASMWTPARWRWLVLLAASYVFYGLVSLRFLILLAIMTIVSFLAARRLAALRAEPDAEHRLFVASIVVIATPLVAFKYTDFLLDAMTLLVGQLGGALDTGRFGFALPLGISFYTIQILGYLIDVHHEMVEPEPHFGRYAAFVAFFPHVTAGPVARSDLLAQFEAPVGFDYDRVTSGVRQVAWGLFMKLVIADRLGIAVDNVYAAPANFSGAAIALILVLYAFQVYADFAGYSAIAIGAARILGVDLGPNFARPYLSRSVGEYWRRWHISFSTWLNEYVYMPFAAKLRTLRVAGSVVALLGTFLVSGLWHGAGFTFVAFGLAHGIVLVGELLTKRWRSRIESRVPRLSSAISWLLTFGFLCWVDVLFRAPTVGRAIEVYRRLFGGLWVDARFLIEHRASIGSLKALFVGLGFTFEQFAFAVASVVLLFVVDVLDERRRWAERIRGWPTPLRWALYYAVAIGLLFFGSHSRSTSFVYYQF